MPNSILHMKVGNPYSLFARIHQVQYPDLSAPVFFATQLCGWQSRYICLYASFCIDFQESCFYYFFSICRTLAIILG